jgi:histidinol-phosphate/aromatic aminotransferase/cobyric acid decarboxylase-like protein
MRLKKTSIEQIAQKIADKPVKLTMTIHGDNEDIHFLGNGIEDSIQLIIKATGGYKAINNPLTYQESTISGHLMEFGGVL